MHKILSVVGVRPNFMKIAPFCHGIEQYNRANNQQINHILLHTGQHYDTQMSRTFFEALNIPEPDINLEIGSGSHAEQVGNTMIAFEKVLREQKPDWVVVVGDVNATCACSITTKKESIKLAHIESGLRSGDLTMPEEINRLVTDRLSDLLLTPDRMSYSNLLDEGIPDKKISFVGNIMIDTLLANREKASELSLESIIEDNALAGQQHDLGFKDSYGFVTLHRPSNVDHAEILQSIVDFIITKVCDKRLMIWPVHPRTKKQLTTHGIWDTLLKHPRLILTEPLGYHELLKINLGASIALTDSGGLQEECCVLGTPCLILRSNTERPITLLEHEGCGILVGNKIADIEEAYQRASDIDNKPRFPEKWDGHTADRILESMLNYE